MNVFVFTKDECNIECGTSLKRHLAWSYDVRISHQHEEMFTFEDEVSGAFSHAKHHPDVASGQPLIINELLCIPLGCVFGANVSFYRLEGIA